MQPIVVDFMSRSVMEQSHSLLLNEAALAELPDHMRGLFIHEWLRFLSKILPVTQKSDMKGAQEKLVEQLLCQMQVGHGAPTRKLLANCLAMLFSIGDTFSLFKTINECNDIIRTPDDAPKQLDRKLCAIATIGAMYSKLGRMVGRSFEETTQLLLKALKSSESLSRTEIMNTLLSMVQGLGSAGTSIHKDVYKSSKLLLVDRAMTVRVAAAKCITALVAQYPLLYNSELENLASSCYKSFDESTYAVRLEVAQLLATLLLYAHQPQRASKMASMPQNQQNNQNSARPFDDCLNLLGAGFLRGGVGFLKGSTGMTQNLSRTTRVGVTMAYEHFIKLLGADLLERNLSSFIKHLLELAAAPGKLGLATSTQPISAGHLEAVYIRRCVLFILRQTISRMLPENAQILACKELGITIAEHMNAIDISIDASVDRQITAESLASQHVLVVALTQLAHLTQQIGTSVQPLFVEANGIMEPVFASLLHPCQPAVIAAAVCLRSVCIALPNLLTPLIDRACSRLEHMKSSADAIQGYSLALASLLTAVKFCPLGIPHNKGKQIFAIAEDLLKTATNSSRLAMAKTQAAWLLISAFITLGSDTVRSNVPRLQLLWKNAFPRSDKAAQEETQRGDIFTWSVTLEARSGALTAMQAFCAHCSTLLVDDTLRRILTPIENCLNMLAYMPDVMRQYGLQLRGPIMQVRLRLYNALAMIRPKFYEYLFPALLRELVAELTLADTGGAPITSSLTGHITHNFTKPLLGQWLMNTDYAIIEQQLHPMHASGCGSHEHDLVQLILGNNPLLAPYGSPANVDAMPDGVSDNNSMGEQANKQALLDENEPMPLAINVIDNAIVLFGYVYSMIPPKHRLQMFDHFNECIRTNARHNAKQQAIQLNVYNALIVAFKSMSENKIKLEGETVQKSAVNLIKSHLSHQSALIRVTAAECLGRLAQVVGDAQFVAAMAQYSFDMLKTQRDVVNRTGHALALGCLHRHVGSLGSGQHLNTSVSILIALAEDCTSPQVQIYSLISLALIADTGGPMFRGYVEPTLGACLKLMLVSSAATNADVAQGVGLLVSALITTVGPELQQTAGQAASMRGSILVLCALLMSHTDPNVKQEAIGCYQQLHLFAPRHIELADLVNMLCDMLSSEHLSLRKASVTCLRQLVQREAIQVKEHTANLMKKEGNDILPETGLEGALFYLLDREFDSNLRSHIQETLLSLVQATASDLLKFWLLLCKEILAKSSTDMLSPGLAEDTKIQLSASAQQQQQRQSEKELDAEDENIFAGDQKDEFDAGTKWPNVIPRWRSRVFACVLLRRIMNLCHSERAHTDLALARELQLAGEKHDFLVLHLSDLVRMSFMAATSDTTQLRLVGLKCLQDVITRFATVPEPEFPGHVILEQYQAQVGAALRPAFAQETPSHVTAAACQVCSVWIGSGVARDLNDLRRVHQLLVSSLQKLNDSTICTQLYAESAATLERLAILKAWAQVYVTAVKQCRRHTGTQNESEQIYVDVESICGESLLSLVRPELNSLIIHWLNALRDTALLALPNEYSIQLPQNGGAFFTQYTMHQCRVYYRDAWPSILLATATWLSEHDFEVNSQCDNVQELRSNDSLARNQRMKLDHKQSRFFLVIGVCMENLCNINSQMAVHTNQNQSNQSSSSHMSSEGSPISEVNVDLQCIRTMISLLDSDYTRLMLMTDVALAVEWCTVLYRVILTRDCLQLQIECLIVIEKILDAAEFAIDLSNNTDAGDDEASDAKSLYAGNEGHPTEFLLGKKNSLLAAVLEVLTCALLRQLPAIGGHRSLESTALATLRHRRFDRLSNDSLTIIQQSSQILARLKVLAAPTGFLTVLPTCLLLTLGVIRESSRVEEGKIAGEINATAAVALHTLRSLCTHTSKMSTVHRHIMNEEGDEHSSPAKNLAAKVYKRADEIMRQALVSTLDLYDGRDAKNDDRPIDLATVLLATAVFLVSCSRQITLTNHITNRCVTLFDICLQSRAGWKTQHKCLQTLGSIFSHRDSKVSSTYINRLAPKLMEILKMFDEENVEVQLKCLPPEAHLLILQECTRCLEALIAKAQPDKRLPLVSFVMQLLLFQLVTGPDVQDKSLKVKHDFAIVKLNGLAPLYAKEFKQVLNAFPNLKMRLEKCLQTKKAENPATIKSRNSISIETPVQQEPSIQLKMDFKF